MSEPIKVMISSRCDVPVVPNEKQTLSDLRKDIKKTIEAWRFIDKQPFDEKQKGKKPVEQPVIHKDFVNGKLLDKEIFEVWINEDAPPLPGDETAMGKCLQQVKDADILIVLYNGHAGGSSPDSNVGICHMELAQAWTTESSKIRIVELPLCGESTDKEEQRRNERFREYVNRLSRFRRTAKNGEEAKKLVFETLHAAVLDLARMGRKEAVRTPSIVGPTLDWSIMDFAGRKKAMEEVIKKYLKEKKGAVDLPSGIPELDKEKTGCARYIKIDDRRVLSIIHAVPSSMSIAEAREMVGRPFYRDYEYANALTDDIIGPVHFIGCYKNVTETQVRNLVGHPDIILITGQFGVYMVDTVQHTQIVFLAGCSTDICTENALASFFEWLRLAETSIMVVENAESRKKIVCAIDDEYKGKKTMPQPVVANP